VTGKPTTIDGYLTAVSDDKRAALERLRRTIRAAAPGAEECISYQLPAFRFHGRMLVAFGAWASHCALYPGSSAVRAYKDDLKNYDTSKGAIRFQADHPLPPALVRKLVRARIAAIESMDQRTSGPAGNSVDASGVTRATQGRSRARRCAANRWAAHGGPHARGSPGEALEAACHSGRLALSATGGGARRAGVVCARVV